MSIKFRSFPVTTFFTITSLLFAATAWAEDYDVVIENGRVMDPETGFDQVANVGISDGVITKITTDCILDWRTSLTRPCRNSKRAYSSRKG